MAPLWVVAFQCYLLIDAARIPVDTGEMIGARSTDPTAAQVAAPGEY